jgi:hypothetical protein
MKLESAILALTAELCREYSPGLISDHERVDQIARQIALAHGLDAADTQALRKASAELMRSIPDAEEVEEETLHKPFGHFVRGVLEWLQQFARWRPTWVHIPAVITLCALAYAVHILTKKDIVPRSSTLTSSKEDKAKDAVMFAKCPSGCPCPMVCGNAQCEAGETCSRPNDCGKPACGECDSSVGFVLDPTVASAGPGCTVDGNGGIVIKCEIISTLMRCTVRKEDGASFLTAGELQVFMGNGPICAINVPNPVKTSVQYAKGQANVSFSFALEPFADSSATGTWEVGASKMFWAGKREGSYDVYRATGFVQVLKTCSP